MVWIKNKKTEKIEESKFSDKFNKKTNFPESKKNWKELGQFDFEDHQLEEKEERDLKKMRDLEERGFI